MAAKTTAAGTALLELILNNVAWTGIGDAGGILPSTADGNFYLSLHSADPGVGGNQTTNELAYTGYVRVAATRNGTQWSVVAATATTLTDLVFGLCTVGGGTATYVGVGTDSVGAGNLIYRALVTVPGAGLLISPGITPKITAGAAVITET